ncbi:MAG TPA: AI-2E family transporter [Pyrinomonadaceae bacterium]|nr:AI-2E family transporter [Pyrinomonadaceae bacterium]
MSSGDERRVGELTVGEAKRLVVYAAATLLALVLFALLVGKVFVALLLGAVAGAYLVPVQAWLERRLRARAGSAFVTISLIIVPLVAVVGFGWHELSDYTQGVTARRDEIADSISRSLSRYLGVGYEQTRATLQTAFSELLVRSAKLFEEFREGAALLLTSATVFFFTVFYVLTHRTKLTAYVKLRVPGEFLPLYERLGTNVGGALRGALWAVFVDQSVKALVILACNLAFRVPLAVALALAAFLVGFFPLLGVWAVYVPVSVYLLVFRDDPLAAGLYLAVGVAVTVGSSLFLRPLLASQQTEAFNFYWMLVGLVAGVYAFGLPGVVLGPAILGFAKAVMDTLAGEVTYEGSLLKEERAQRDEELIKQ